MDEICPLRKPLKKRRKSGFWAISNPGGKSSWVVALEMAGVGKTFEDGRQALTDVSLRIEKGNLFICWGERGGKTTFLRLLYAAERPLLGNCGSMDMKCIV